MTDDQIIELADRYEARFGNLDEILHPSLMFDPKMTTLLVKALHSGQPLTRAAVESVFGDLGWEE